MAITPFEQAHFNLVSFAETTVDLFDSTPKDVAIQLKDSNGNLYTKTLQNRGKFQKKVWDDVGAALGQFNRTFYVDAENGSDTNDGSSSHPFKTLRKAVDSVPIGGVGTIYIVGDYTLDSDVHTNNKYIAIISNNNFIIDSYITGDGKNYFKHQIFGFDNTLYISVNTLIIAPNYDGTKGNDGRYDIAICAYNEAAHTKTPGFFNLIIDANNKNGDFIQQHGLVLFGAQAPWGSGFITNVNLSLKRYNYIGNSIYRAYGGLIFRGANMSLTVDNKGFIKFKDGSDTELSWADKISTITRDTNNIPRNIVSNIIL